MSTVAAQAGAGAAVEAVETLTELDIRPQEGRQRDFLQSPADIVIYGGAAGGGKTYGLLLDPLRYIENPHFDAIIFRRSIPEVTQQGGLWDKSMEIYPLLDAIPHQTYKRWTFESGATIKFGHLQYAKSVLDYQGSEIPYIGWDELTHFTRDQFFYMLTRNRSTSGIRPCMRAGCNPDPESWVADFISWWIDQDTGYPLLERAGVLRWFIVNGAGDLQWADSPEELKAIDPVNLPKSVTFIPAKLEDNPILVQKDPGYLANLMAQDPVTRARLLQGNWKVKPEAGDNFNRADWGAPVEAPQVPLGGVACRYFDWATTKKERTREVMGKKDPDYTVGFLTQQHGDLFYQWDSTAVQEGPAEVEDLFYRIVEADLRWAKERRVRYKIRWEEEPASAGKRDSSNRVSEIRRRFAGRYGSIDAAGIKSSGDKAARALTLASEIRQGHVRLVKDGSHSYWRTGERGFSPWNERYLTHMHHQYAWPHDDEHDASVGSFNEVAGVKRTAFSTRVGGSRSRSRAAKPAGAPTPASSMPPAGSTNTGAPSYSPYAAASERPRPQRKGQPRW
jgi:phage terminase large subunit-like protein